MQHWQQEALFTAPVEAIIVSARWDRLEGWSVGFMVRREGEDWGAHDRELHTRLTLAEMLQLVDDLVLVYRGF